MGAGTVAWQEEKLSKVGWWQNQERGALFMRSFIHSLSSYRCNVSSQEEQFRLTGISCLLHLTSGKFTSSSGPQIPAYKLGMSTMPPQGLRDRIAYLCPARLQLCRLGQMALLSLSSSRVEAVTWCPASSAQLARWAGAAEMIMYLAAFRPVIGLPTCRHKAAQSV